MKKAAKNQTRLDEKYIREVAEDQGITERLSSEVIQKAHNYATQGASEDYYYRLKEFFC